MVVRIAESAELKLAQLLLHESQELTNEMRDIDDAALALENVRVRSGLAPNPNLTLILGLTSQMQSFASEIVVRAEEVLGEARVAFA